MSTRAPRVVHLVPALFGDDGVVGGAERYAFELARAMARVVPTVLVSFGTTGRRERIDDLEVHVIGRSMFVRGQRSNPVAPGLLGELRHADIVHCHQQHVLATSLAAAACRVLGKRVYVSDLGGGGWDVSAYISTDRWFHGHLHISEYSRQVSGHEQMKTARVILGGVDATRFVPAPVRAAAGPALFVGRVLPHKGIDYLVRGLPDAIGLEIVGRQTHAAYAAHLRELARGRRVTFRDAYDDRELLQAYRRAACIVLPSVYEDVYGARTRVPELLGQSLLEGMACGLPAICTAVASMPEIVMDGVTGVVVPPNDPAAVGRAIASLQADADAADAMGARACHRARTMFSWEAVVARCLDAYGIAPEVRRAA